MMKKSLKRILAIICCVAVVLTGISVDNLFGKGVQAAEPTATSVMSLNIESVNNLLGMATGGFLNIPYTGVATDYTGSGSNFLDAAFAEKYMTFGGGMTYEDLSEGLQSFYVANNSILQMNWANRTSAFTEGWSFTIAQGALLPYRSTNGTAYMALDREYTFTFADREGGGNLVRLKAYYVTSFGMTVDTEYGSGTLADAGTVFHFADAATNEIKDYRTKYTDVYNDSAYADYIDISGYAFSELESASLKLRYILDNGTECFQFESWGDARNTLTTGDQIILREGLPIYYIGTNGYNYKALLDGTYVYECVGSNAQHNQTFVGMKYDSTKNVFGINTNANGVKTVAQSATNLEQYINIGFDSNSQNTITDTTATINILGEMIAEEYIQIADYTVEKARELGMTFRFIPNANVLQLGFKEAAVDALEVGDQIILKAGLPVVYKVSGSKLSSATLDNNYVITVLENNGTNLTLEYVLTDTYGLSGAASKGSDNGYASTGFVNMFFNDEIPAGESFQEVIKDAKGNANSDNLLKKGYFSISGYDYEDLKSVITLKAFNISALRGFRFVYTVSGVTFKDGDVAMWKAGLPISYNVSAGGTTKHKTIYLDKDYGFVYDDTTSTFVYDSSLVSQPEETPVETTATLNLHTQSQLTGTDGRTNLHYTSSDTIVADGEVANILSNEETATYIDMCGVDTASLISNNVSIKFIPSAACFQIAWGSDLSWVQEGGLITFTKGMPVYYTSDNVKKRAVLEETVVYEITEVEGATIKIEKYVPTVQYAIPTNDLGTGVSTNIGSNSTLNILNVETGANNVLADAARVYSPLSAATIEEYIDFFGMASEEITNYGVTIRFIKDGATEVLQILWGTSMDALENGDELVLKKGLPFTYTTQSGETKKIVLNQDYTFVVHNGNATNTKILKIKTVKEEVIPNFTFRTESALTGADGRTNLYYVPDVEVVADGDVNNILTNAETAGYIDMCGVDIDTLLANNVRIKFIPSESCFQIVWGDDLSWVKAGDIITFSAGMPVYYVTEGKENHAILQKAAVYEITSVNGTTIQVDTYVEKVEFSLDKVQFGTGTKSDANATIKILDPQTGANNRLDDANRIYAPLSDEIVASYVDVCGLTAQDIQDCGMSFRFIRNGATQVLQILWGTSASELEIGSYLIFKQGLPFTYTTTDGSPKTVVLDKDYIFEATGGNSTNTRVFNYVTTTTVTKKEWTLKNGAIYNTARGTVEGYYNNISLGTSELTEDLQSLNVILDAATLAEYVDFAGIEPSRYVDLGIKAIVVIAGNTKVVQLRWGETTSLVEAGDEIIFKKGMPITVTKDGAKTVYELDADYVFTVSEHTDGANGYRITTSKIDEFNVVIKVDGAETVNGLYKTGTKFDLEQYRNTAKGKVMSIQINGVSTQNTEYIVSEDAEIVIANRSDICIVVFKDEGVVVATREYLLTDENVKLPYAPDKDGYDDSWEKFELKNGVIYVNAIHTLKASTHPTIKLSGVVIEDTDKPANNSNATSPQTGDGATTVAWIVVSAAALMFVILKLAEKNKAGKER